MENIPSDIRLGIFKYLTSVEASLVREVCQDWFQIPEENESLWRSLVPPLRWPSEPNVLSYHKINALNLFDEKSHSTMREIIIECEILKFQGLLKRY